MADIITNQPVVIDNGTGEWIRSGGRQSRLALPSYCGVHASGKASSRRVSLVATGRRSSSLQLWGGPSTSG
jgi:hypothetical protein